MSGSKKGERRGGRQKGTPNKATADVRAAIALIAQSNVEVFEEWIHQIKDPAKRCEIFLKVIEYYIPKLSRSEVTGSGGGPVTVKIVDPTRKHRR